MNINGLKMTNLFTATYGNRGGDLWWL